MNRVHVRDDGGEKVTFNATILRIYAARKSFCEEFRETRTGGGRSGDIQTACPRFPLCDYRPAAVCRGPDTNDECVHRVDTRDCHRGRQENTWKYRFRTYRGGRSACCYRTVVFRGWHETRTAKKKHLRRPSIKNFRGTQYRGAASNRDGVTAGIWKSSLGRDRGWCPNEWRIRVRILERKTTSRETTRMRFVNFKNMRFKLKKRNTDVFFESKIPRATSRCRCEVCARPTRTNACSYDAIVPRSWCFFISHFVIRVNFSFDNSS